MKPYAKYINETTIQYPTDEEFKGVINWRQHDQKLREKGYAPIENMPENQADKNLILDTFSFTEVKTQVVEPQWDGSKWIDAQVEKDESYITVLTYHYEDIPIPAPSYSDYDAALEDYIYSVRAARGYTDREPSSNNYYAGTNERWKQDALDWIPFFQRVMEYGLEILNKYNANESVPTLDEFREELQKIKIEWTYKI